MDDISVEEERSDEASFRDPKAEVQKLKEKLKRCEEERKEYLDGWQRAKADFVNFKREQGEAQEAFVRFANRGLLLEFILIADSFDRATADHAAWGAVPENWRVGMEHLRGQILGVLRAHGIEPFSDVGERFDPERHETVSEEKVDSREKEGIILSVLLQGYTMHGEVIRPARVIVGTYE